MSNIKLELTLDEAMNLVAAFSPDSTNKELFKEKVKRLLRK
jgi:hypothetical protein